MKQKEVKRLIDESLVYERAYSRVCRILNDLMEDKNRDINMARETGEKADESYKLLVDKITEVRDALRDKSDELFKTADAAAYKYERGYENLFNAIVLRAAQDYESKLCGYGDLSSKHVIEMMPPEHMLSEKIMRRIQDGHKKFEKVIRERGKDILAETEQARREKRDIDLNTIKCPLCGGALYAYGKMRGGSQQIKCTGCSLFGWSRICDENAS